MSSASSVRHGVAKGLRRLVYDSTAFRSCWFTNVRVNRNSVTQSGLFVQFACLEKRQTRTQNVVVSFSEHEERRSGDCEQRLATLNIESRGRNEATMTEWNTGTVRCHTLSSSHGRLDRREQPMHNSKQLSRIKGRQGEYSPGAQRRATSRHQLVPLDAPICC